MEDFAQRRAVDLLIVVLELRTFSRKRDFQQIPIVGAQLLYIIIAVPSLPRNIGYMVLDHVAVGLRNKNTGGRDNFQSLEVQLNAEHPLYPVQRSVIVQVLGIEIVSDLALVVAFGFIQVPGVGDNNILVVGRPVEIVVLVIGV